MDREIIDLYEDRDARPMVLDFHDKRAIIFMDISWIDGKKLEPIEKDMRGRRMGAVLVKREWRDLYVVNIKDGWEDQKYFDHAQKLIDASHL